MSQEQLTEWDVEIGYRLMGRVNKKAGRVVETATGKVGRTYNHESPVFGKIRVYTDDGEKLLCDPEKLIIKGFID